MRTAVRFLAVLSGSDHLSVRDLAKLAGMGERQAYRWLRAAEESGAVQIERIGIQPVRYRIAKLKPPRHRGRKD